MTVNLDNYEYEERIIRKNNRNTYIRVRDGMIVVTTNYFTSEKSIEKLIKDNKISIMKMVKQDSKKQEREDNFYYFGKSYDVVYGFLDVSIEGNKIYAKDEKSLFRYLNESIVKIYLERLMYWYNVFEEDIPKPNLKIRKMTSRWGVCNTKNHNVTLNYQLVKYDISCLDYVIVHELSHFIHPNHSKEFWGLVGKYYPRYKECRRMLKE